MNELIAQIKNQIAAAQAAFARLTQREQIIMLGLAGGIILLILVVVGVAVSSAIDGAEHRVKVKTKQLNQLIALQGEYKAREQQRQTRLKELGRSNTRLVSLIESVAKQAGVEIGQLRPEDSEPNADGIIESRVDLRASNLSADRLQDFLSRLETSPGIVIIRRLKVSRPFRRDVADIELTITTYQLKAG
ncbi:MAG: type 4a pilus biogenesis protein PilO [Deltaproteobacteria bacterium]|nr:type 4a pilus biogenesis protein PilO [Deltaproteobacteria bacterium]